MIELATQPKVVAPYSFDGPYSGCYAQPEVAIDKRHVYIIHEILSSWPFKSALELGSFNGASATAFIEAINRGRGMDATFCDICPTESLLDVIKSCRFPSQLLIDMLPSSDMLAREMDFDFILVDACHDIKSVTPELKELLRRKPLCIMAHDTNATEAGYPLCEGAAMLKNAFLSMPNYRCLEDSVDRPNERTNRGLFFATTDKNLHDIAAGIFEKWK